MRAARDIRASVSAAAMSWLTSRTKAARSAGMSKRSMLCRWKKTSHAAAAAFSLSLVLAERDDVAEADAQPARASEATAMARGRYMR